MFRSIKFVCLSGLLAVAAMLASGEMTKASAQPLVNRLYVITPTDAPNLAIDVPNANVVSGQRLQLFAKHGRANQVWLMGTAYPKAGFVIRSYASPNGSKVLDVPGNNVNLPIQLFQANGGDNQRWAVVPAPEGRNVRGAPVFRGFLIINARTGAALRPSSFSSGATLLETYNYSTTPGGSNTNDVRWTFQAYP